MSERLGRVALTEGQCEKRNFSEHTAALVDEEVRVLLAAAHSLCTGLLKGKRADWEGS